MPVEPHGGMDKAYWVILQDHNMARKFYSSHDSKADAQALAAQKNAEEAAHVKQLLADAEALEQKQNSTPEDKHRANIKRQDAGLFSRFSVRDKPPFVEGKVMGADGEWTGEIATRVVPQKLMGQTLSGAKVSDVPVMTRVPVMVPDPNWVNQE